MKIEVEKPGVNVIDAAARGAGDGLQLALNIGAMLIAFLALIAMVNGVLGWVHTLALGWFPDSLQKIVRHRLRAGRLAAGRDVEGRHGGRQPAGHAPGAERIRRVPRARPGEGISSTRARSSSPRTPCAASPISAPSPSRSAASARWRPAAKSDLARLGLRAVAAGTHGELHVGLHRGTAVMNQRLMTDTAVAAIMSRIRMNPTAGVVLGSGLGAFADELRDPRRDRHTPRSRAGRPRPPSATPAS